jgi:hypothetical protein
MATKLVIVNNGLKNLRGHFFETAVALAEAARQAGYQPVLAANVECPVDLIPGWLECHPIFHTDHYMAGPPPPARASSTRQAHGLRRRFLDAGKRALRGTLPPAYAAVRRTYRRLRRAYRAFRFHTFPSGDELQRQLARIGFTAETAHIDRFQRDLARLLQLAGVRGGDHVFLPTAHGRELIAVQRLRPVLDETGGPMFHFEFRHALDVSGCFDDTDEVHPYTALHCTYFEHFRRQTRDPRLRLYTDTEELSAEYQRFTGLAFATLPIPFRAGLIAPRVRRPGEPLCLAFFGEVRDEKGFVHLPDLVAALRADYLVPRKARLLVQATLAARDGHNEKSHAALSRLRRERPEHVTLVGLDGPLTPAQYYRLVSEADVFLCPYSPHAYRSRSSGTFAEAVAAGIPTVVPHATWMHGQQPPGSGVTFTDPASLSDGVRRLCDDYPRYLRAARAHQDAWRAVHTPANLLNVLVRPGREAARVA